jgi:enoyl-CoA hydratase
MAELLVERRGAIAVLTFHRPDRLNAVNEALYRGLLAALAELDGDRTVRAVVLTGAGRAFCVGADLQGHKDTARDDEARRTYVRLGQAAAKALMTCPKPVVAAINGHAIGAGLELALACDLSIVDQEAKLRFPELGLGTFVGGGVMRTLPARAGAARARELLLLGRFFRGKDAVEYGLCNRAVPATDVLNEAIAWAEEAAEKAPQSIAFAKQLLAHPPTDLDALLAKEAEHLFACMQTQDWREGIQAFAERRTPKFAGD